jgi:hypothetical protein
MGLLGQPAQVALEMEGQPAQMEVLVLVVQEELAEKEHQY